MFQKLKLQLILSHLVLSAVLFFLWLAGTYFLFRTGMNDSVPDSLPRFLIIAGTACQLLIYLVNLFLVKRIMAPIQKVWQQQRNFLADASHKLRTPLAIIQTNLDVVLDNTHETIASQLDWLNIIRGETGQMMKLVNSLLLLAHLDSGKRFIKKIPFSLIRMAACIIKAFEPSAAAKGVALSMSAASEIIAYGDESGIRQVVEILIDNAIRHTPPEGKVSLAITRRNAKIQLIVADTGEGIAPQYLDKIFDRFYQIDASCSNGEAGLGLAIAKSIIENYEGTIDVLSTPGLGTRFMIQLPITPAVKEPLA